MSSIPFDFDNLSTLASSRISKYASTSSTDEGTSFIDHFQATAPADANPPDQSSAAPNLTNGPTSPQSNVPNTSVNNDFVTTAPREKTTKESAEDKTKDNDDSNDATSTGPAAADQSTTPPVVAQQQEAIAKDTSAAKKNATAETADETKSEGSGETKTSADGKGNTSAATATATTAAKIPGPGAANQKVLATAAVAAKTANTHDEKKDAKTAEPASAVAATSDPAATTTTTTASPTVVTPPTTSPQNAAATTGATQAAETQVAATIQAKTDVTHLTSKKGAASATNANEAAATDAANPEQVGTSKKATAALKPSVSAAAATPESAAPVTDPLIAPAAIATQTPEKKQGAKADANPGNMTVPLGPALPALPTSSESRSSSKDESLPAIGPPSSQAQTPTSNVDPAAANVPRFAANLLSQGTSSTANGSPLSGVDQTRFLQRVAKAFQAAQDQDGEIRLRLSPAELGSMKLEIKVQDGVMTVRMETESASTKDLLLDNLPALRERLADQGIRVDKFDVNVMDQQSSGNGANNMPRGDDRQAAQPNMPRFERESNHAKVSESPPTARVPSATDGRLNVVV